MILDTNAVSALAAKERNLINRIRSAPRICVTLITLGEYRFGMLGSDRQSELEHWLNRFLEKSEVLSPDLATLPYYAAIRHELKSAGTPIPANDCWIAALVRQHQMELVSRDTHFDQVKGVKRVAW